MAIDATQPEAFVRTFDRTERISNSAHELHEGLTVDEVAALLKVSRSWVYEHTRSRGMPRSERLPHKIGKYVRFDPRAVRASLERQCRTT